MTRARRWLLMLLAFMAVGAALLVTWVPGEPPEVVWMRDAEGGGLQEHEVALTPGGDPLNLDWMWWSFSSNTLLGEWSVSFERRPSAWQSVLARVPGRGSTRSDSWTYKWDSSTTMDAGESRWIRLLRCGPDSN